MKEYEIRKRLRDARVEAQTAMEDYIQGVRNAPHVTLSRALLRARAYRTLLELPGDKHALGWLQDIEDEKPYTRSMGERV